MSIRASCKSSPLSPVQVTKCLQLVAIIGALKANHSYSVDLQAGEGDAVAPGDSVELALVHYSVDEGIQLAVKLMDLLITQQSMLNRMIAGVP